MAQVQSLARELQHAAGVAKYINKQKFKEAKVAGITEEKTQNEEEIQRKNSGNVDNCLHLWLKTLHVCRVKPQGARQEKLLEKVKLLEICKVNNSWSLHSNREHSGFSI